MNERKPEQPAAGWLVALQKIKVECLTATNALTALGHITRLCIDAGVREPYYVLQERLGAAAADNGERGSHAEPRSSAAPGSALALGEWQRKLPDESGLWWWWNEDEDSLPIVVAIAYSGTSDSYFAMQGQHGWTRYQDVDEMGGWWRWLPEPERPTQNDQALRPLGGSV